MDFDIKKYLNPPADILYTDPPWGDVMLRRFARTVEKSTGVLPEQPAFEELCDQIANIIRQGINNYVFVEMGKQAAPVLIEAIKPTLQVLQTTVFDYGTNQDGVLIYGSKNEAQPITIESLKGLKGLRMVQQVLSLVATPNALVFDPCCGAGYTARAATSLGMRFIGNELNPLRLKKARSFFTESDT